MVSIEAKRQGHVCIMGCGWLGMPLAQHLIMLGYQISGTTTSEQKLSTLRKAGVRPYVMELRSTLIPPHYEDLWLAHTFIINIPPGRRDPVSVAQYPAYIDTLLHRIQKHSSDARILLVSSTSVYADNNNMVDETSPLKVEGSGYAIVETERRLQELFATERVLILRLAGLAGPARYPGTWYEGKKDVRGGNTPVNLVHQQDCIHILAQAIADPTLYGVYNVCAHEHPLKKILYPHLATKAGAMPPTFSDDVLPHKVVNNQKLKSFMQYQYRYPDPMLFPFP